jgi:hypothetical protein
LIPMFLAGGKTSEGIENADELSFGEGQLFGSRSDSG